MHNHITDFVKLLSNNKLEVKIVEIPEEFEHADELMAELSESDIVPDSMRYFEINGYSSPYDLSEFLEDGFNNFKIAYIASGYPNDNKIKEELSLQITSIRNKLLKLVENSIQLNDISLNSLIEKKIEFCDETFLFINNQHKSLVSTDRQTKKRKNRP